MKKTQEKIKKKEKVGGKTDIFLNFQSKLRHVNCQYQHDLTLQPSSNSQRAEECHSYPTADFEVFAVEINKLVLKVNIFHC